MSALIIDMMGSRGNFFSAYHKCIAEIKKSNMVYKISDFNKEALRSYEDFWRVYDRDFDFRTDEERAEDRKNATREKMTLEDKQAIAFL